MASCFNCKAKPPAGWSAYCAECQPVGADPPLTGNASLCRPCGQVFTSVSAFDLHRPGECLDAGTAERRNGKPVFAAYRTLADDTPVWGQHDDRSRPGWYREAVGEKISRPNGVPDVSLGGVAA